MFPIHSYAKGDAFDEASGSFLMVSVTDDGKAETVFSIRPTLTGLQNRTSAMGKYIKMQFSLDHCFLNEEVTPLAIEHLYTPPTNEKITQMIHRIGSSLLSCDVGFIHELPSGVDFGDVLEVRPKKFEIYESEISFQYCLEKEDYLRVFSWKIKTKALLILRDPTSGDVVEFTVSSPKHKFKMSADYLLMHCADIGLKSIGKLDLVKSHEDLSAIRLARSTKDIEPILLKYKHLVFSERFKKLFDEFELIAVYRSRLNRHKTAEKKSVKFKDELVEVRLIPPMLSLDPTGYRDDHFYTKEDEKDFIDYFTEDSEFFATVLSKPDHPDYEEAMMTLKRLVPPSNITHQLHDIVETDELMEPGKILLLPKGRAIVIGKDRKRKETYSRDDLFDFISPKLHTHGVWNDFKVKLIQLLLEAI